MPKVLAKETGGRILHTAVRCLNCNIPLHPNRRGPTIQYTCSKICRRMLRGGRRNKRILVKLFNREGKSWSNHQLHASLRYSVAEQRQQQEKSVSTLPA